MTALNLFPIFKMGIKRNPLSWAVVRTQGRVKPSTPLAASAMDTCIHAPQLPHLLSPWCLFPQLCPIVDVVLGLVNDQLGLVDCKCSFFAVVANVY